MLKASLENIEKVQQDLYHSTLREAEALANTNNLQLINYEKNFQNDFKTAKLGSITKEELSKKINDYKLVLFGDFHTLKQSQKSFLWTVSQASKAKFRKKPVICLEMTESCNQNHIDDFLTGKISERDFLIQLNYEQSWGFPWQNYKIIFDFAKYNNIKIYGINHPSALTEESSLDDRDFEIARNIQSVLKKHSQQQVFCLIGEFHLAKNHLMKQLEEQNIIKRNERIRIFHNLDSIHFQTIEHAHKPDSKFFRLSPHTYCIQNTAPWMKWKSFCIWEEIKDDNDLEIIVDDDQELIFIENEFDLSHQVTQTIQSICASLGISLPKEKLHELTCYYNPDAEKIYEFENHVKYDQNEKLFFSHLLNFYGYCYYPHQKSAVFNQISLNKLFSACGYIISSILLESSSEKDMSTNEKLLFQMMFSNLCVHILNPNKSILTLTNLATKNKAKKKSRKGRYSTHQKALDQTLRIFGAQVSFDDIIDSTRDKEFNLDGFEFYRVLSRILAGRIYTSLIEKTNNTPNLLELEDPFKDPLALMRSTFSKGDQGLPLAS